MITNLYKRRLRYSYLNKILTKINNLVIIFCCTANQIKHLAKKAKQTICCVINANLGNQCLYVVDKVKKCNKCEK